LQQLIKKTEEYVITDEQGLLKDYECSVPRNDQIKARAERMGLEIAALVDLIRVELLAEKNIDKPNIVNMGLMTEEFSFPPNKYLFKIEYLRIEFDSFGRLKYEHISEET
jgi:hypothetical protein